MGFAPLDPVLHNQLRLAVVSLLIAVDEADFTYLLERTGATRGNLSVQLTKLKEAGYVQITKGYKDNYPNTSCRLTKAGVKAFEQYVKAIKGYLQ
ncbi:MAG: transcriptional regulator [Flavobacteriales bacterium]|jgi:DNA-binding MarR family transcriptional regulator